ncbi:AAA family ATPase, CDC48 subfamily [Thermogladius calderae 1633]|uniref:AAA family ATPase, CDC48 subfamily n=1 Tax=Thermogladius calderae (strain DSM 22663 / VKM B-2946 / 1633) TaxID=1184251 RepID=I3TE00_THEC1|nr:CDC48 family AAA ATPase [Thermogladius calderae]AFK50988.1 AAA family ATPase, CDC48 subfamily [Thermogladius calderae 1633]
MSSERVKLTLRVLEAEPKDVGKGIGRVDPEVLERTGLMNGDIVVIEGKRRTVVRVMESKPQDRGLGVIRIDNTTRQNAGVKIGDLVIVEKTEAANAVSIKLAPSKYYAPPDSQLADFVKNKLLNRPLVEEDIVVVPVLGQTIPFKVIYTKPKGPVVVTKDTIVTISEKPMETYRLPRVTYEDIGGMKHIIQRVRELIELPLKHPELFRKLGIEPPKGILLYGPPGTGKTLLAKAVANEADAYFIAINGPEIMSKYYGESEQRLRDIFEQAKKNAPAIIFIDEIDAIAPKRDEVVGEVERRVVAQLLALMDGLEARGDVIVIGATNRPNALDPALRRPGRFDREIEIPMPDKNARLEILQIHTRGVPLAKDVDLNKLAEITHGYTGADLAALVREAALHALRRYLPEINLDSPSIPFEILEKMEVRMEDFMAAYKEIVPSGLREVFVEVPEVKWSDIGGLESIKQELRMSIEWPIKYPETFKRIGIKPPKGILLYGPPGTGKTLLAKAVATESGANFIAIRGPEVLSKWVGESERAIREVFRKARLYAPAVIFMDEIDAIAPVRGFAYDSGVSERVVSQLITEMDGIEKLENVVVIAATNRPDILDPALLRPGRFDKLIYVPPPDPSSRLEIFKIHTRNMPLADDVDLYELAKQTEGYSGADIEALVREAALIAIREDLTIDRVYMRHFNEALNKVKPSITQEMIKFYIEWGEKAKQKLPKEHLRPQVYT